MNHGLSRYTGGKCRCDTCRYAYRRYRAGLRAFNRSHGIEPPVHGTTNGYDNYGCRCADCTAAVSAYRRELYARKRR